jgi:hypothetical protein
VSVALVIQQAKGMGRIMLPVACSAMQYFFVLSHKPPDIRKKVIEHKMLQGVTS